MAEPVDSYDTAIAALLCRLDNPELSIADINVITKAIQRLSMTKRRETNAEYAQMAAEWIGGGDSD